MTDAFVELLPDAPLNGLVEPHIGRDWSERNDRILQTP